MAFSAVPYALQNGSHSADLFRQATSAMIPAGGGIVTTGDLAVTQTGTASMNVNVGVGRIFIPGTNVGNVTGGNFSSQAMYYGQNNAAYAVTIATSDPTNPRIDVVYASVQDSQYAGTTNTGVLSVATGVPASGATYPANAPTIPANSVALAWINVPALASSILTANITQLATIGIASAVPKGLQSLTTVTASGGSVTALTVINNIASFTFKGGRKYRIRWDFKYQGNTAGNYLTALIGLAATTDGAGLTTGITQIDGTPWKIHDTGIDSSGYCDATYTPSTDATLQIKFLIQVTTGAGTARISASTTQPATYKIEDLGAQF